MWCWRCRMDLPMLDEDEYAIVAKLYHDCMQATTEFRQQYNLPLAGCSIEERFRPVRQAYEQMTGMDEPNENAIMHHRISIYGPPCKKCNKPLRTPRANFCAACGQTRD